MNDASRDHFECPSCGRLFAWNPAYHGRNVKCTCGTVFNAERPVMSAVPPVPGQAVGVSPGPTRVVASGSAGSAVESAEGMASARTAARAREARERSAAVVEAVGAFPMSHRARGAALAEDEGRVINNFYLPVGLLVAGGLIWLAQGIFSHAAVERGVLFNIAVVVVAMACNAGVMMAAMVAAAYVLGVNYGSVGQVTLKLTAMAVFCGAVFMFVAQLDDHHSIRGPILAWHVVVLLYWLLYSMLFELDVQETVMSVAIVAIAQAVVAWVVLH